MPINFTLGKCTTRAGYSAKLKSPRKLNLAAIKKAFPTVLETPIVLVIKTGAGEVVVHNYGELLFKEGKDMEVMEKVAKKIYDTGV